MQNGGGKHNKVFINDEEASKKAESNPNSIDTTQDNVAKQEKYFIFY